MSRETLAFGKKLADFATETKQTLNDVSHGIVVELFSSIVLDTPVGMPELWKRKPPKSYRPGQARGSWTATSGTPAAGTSRVIDITASGVLAEIQALSRDTNQIKYLTNGVPYIDRLEYDAWSTQMPAGMVRRNIARIEAIIHEVASRVKK